MVSLVYKYNLGEDPEQLHGFHKRIVVCLFTDIALTGFHLI